LVKKGKAQPVISLDPIHHKVVIGSQSVELQPLTFGLFAKLLEHKNQVVSITVLTDEVWGNVTVSPDTLKQRIFLLRKALEEAGVEACSVQSVRGQGYRLVVPEEKRASGTTIHRRRLLRAYGLIAIAVFVAVYVWQGRQSFDLPPNNRVVFWKASPADSIGDDAGNWEQMWITRLSSSDKMSFVASRRDPEQTISEQARQTRTALISRWTLFENDGQRWVRMQILEPKTAGILRSDLAVLDDSDAMAELLNLQTDAIERILESGVLPLSREALNSTDHPAWARLRDLANDPGQ
jgi:DNA-binding winged helix-turn-helix (wHTH) protein